MGKWLLYVCMPLILIEYVLGCSENHVADSGTFTSPNYPSNYGNFRDCSYSVTPLTTTYSLSLVFEYFRTEDFYDYVEIYDGSDQYLFSISGGPYRWIVIRTLPGFRVQLLTDHNFQAQGFKAHWTVAPSSEIVYHRIAMAVGCGISGQFDKVPGRKIGLRKVEVIELPNTFDCMLLCHNVFRCRYFQYDSDGMCNMLEEDALDTTIYGGLKVKVTSDIQLPDKDTSS